jgi:hypothetical protein
MNDGIIVKLATVICPHNAHSESAQLNYAAPIATAIGSVAGASIGRVWMNTATSKENSRTVTAQDSP